MNKLKVCLLANLMFAGFAPMVHSDSESSLDSSESVYLDDSTQHQGQSSASLVKSIIHSSEGKLSADDKFLDVEMNNRFFAVRVWKEKDGDKKFISYLIDPAFLYAMEHEGKLAIFVKHIKDERDSVYVRPFNPNYMFLIDSGDVEVYDNEVESDADSEDLEIYKGQMLFNLKDKNPAFTLYQLSDQVPFDLSDPNMMTGHETLFQEVLKKILADHDDSYNRGAASGNTPLKVTYKER